MALLVFWTVVVAEEEIWAPMLTVRRLEPEELGLMLKTVVEAFPEPKVYVRALVMVGLRVRVLKALEPVKVPEVRVTAASGFMTTVLPVRVVVAVEALVRRVPVLPVPVRVTVDEAVSSPPVCTSMWPEVRAFCPLVMREEVAEVVRVMVVVPVTVRVSDIKVVRPLLVVAAVGLTVRLWETSTAAPKVYVRAWVIVGEMVTS